MTMTMTMTMTMRKETGMSRRMRVPPEQHGGLMEVEEEAEGGSVSLSGCEAVLVVVVVGDVC